MVVSLLWMVVAPAYASGLALVARLLIPVLEESPDARYVVEGRVLLAQRPMWLPKQGRMSVLNWPLWHAAGNFGVPLLAALVLATPAWGWRRRGWALAVGLGLLTLTQIAFVLVAAVATQQSPTLSPDGMLLPPGFSPVKKRVFYGLFTFFEVMGRGFFTLLIYLALVAFAWPAPAPRAEPRPSARTRRGPRRSGRR